MTKQVTITLKHCEKLAPVFLNNARLKVEFETFLNKEFFHIFDSEDGDDEIIVTDVKES